MSGDGSRLATRGLQVGYGRTPVLTVDDLDLPCGEWWALVGPNGCGKTTLLDTLAGRRTALAGEVWIDGHSLMDAPREARSALGVALPPDALPARLTLRECLSVFTAAHGRAAPDAAVESLIEQWRLSDRLDDFVDRSSLGTRQKLAVLLALVAAPRMLLLDESFNGLDPESGLALKAQLETFVRARGGAVLMATHSLDLVERYADRALLIGRGRVCAELDRAELDAHRGRLDVRLAELARAEWGDDTR